MQLSTPSDTTKRVSAKLQTGTTVWYGAVWERRGKDLSESKPGHCGLDRSFVRSLLPDFWSRRSTLQVTIPSTVRTRPPPQHGDVASPNPRSKHSQCFHRQLPIRMRHRCPLGKNLHIKSTASHRMRRCVDSETCARPRMVGTTSIFRFPGRHSSVGLHSYGVLHPSSSLSGSFIAVRQAAVQYSTVLDS